MSETRSNLKYVLKSHLKQTNKKKAPYIILKVCTKYPDLIFDFITLQKVQMYSTQMLKSGEEPTLHL